MPWPWSKRKPKEPAMADTFPPEATKPEPKADHKPHEADTQKIVAPPASEPASASASASASVAVAVSDDDCALLAKLAAEAEVAVNAQAERLVAARKDAEEAHARATTAQAMVAATTQALADSQAALVIANEARAKAEAATAAKGDCHCEDVDCKALADTFRRIKAVCEGSNA